MTFDLRHQTHYSLFVVIFGMWIDWKEGTNVYLLLLLLAAGVAVVGAVLEEVLVPLLLPATVLLGLLQQLLQQANDSEIGKTNSLGKNEPAR